MPINVKNGHCMLAIVTKRLKGVLNSVQKCQKMTQNLKIEDINCSGGGPSVGPTGPLPLALAAGVRGA